jgi:hypothetical protein
MTMSSATKWTKNAQYKSIKITLLHPRTTLLWESKPRKISITNQL